MKRIPLTRGYVALVDDEDYERVAAFKWQAVVTGKYRLLVYAQRAILRHEPRPCQSYIMHRFILGITDRRIMVDHIDGNGLNNQRDNLRVATNSQNQSNSQKQGRSCSSQYKGVHLLPNKKPRWAAVLQGRTAGKKWVLYLGTFAIEKEAALAYDAAAKKHFGEFAKLNFAEASQNA